MEVLLAKKIEAAAAQASGSTSDPSKLFRNDSFDSVSSLGSLSSIVLGDDVCRCDDCLLGIVDLWIAGPAEKALFKKKVLDILFVHFSSWQLIQLVYPIEYVLFYVHSMGSGTGTNVATINLQLLCIGIQIKIKCFEFFSTSKFACYKLFCTNVDLFFFCEIRTFMQTTSSYSSTEFEFLNQILVCVRCLSNNNKKNARF